METIKIGDKKFDLHFGIDFIREMDKRYSLNGNGVTFGMGIQSAKRHAVFTKGYSTGATKRSISLELTAGGFEGHVKSGTDYSGYLEKGTRFMEAQPFMKPAFDEIEPQFIAELRRAAIVK